MSSLIVGCGYLGQRLGMRLHRLGESVFGTVRSERRAEELREDGIEPVILDVLATPNGFAWPEVERVFYCVGFDRAAGATMRAVYVDGLRRVLEGLPETVRRIVYASSTGVYGQTDGDWVNEASVAEPVTESGSVCLEAEGLVSEWASTRGVSSVVLRFTGLYGPGRVVRRDAIERGEAIRGDGERFLNLIHIDDAVTASFAALFANHVEPLYLVCDDRPVRRREYYGLAAKLLGAPEPRFEKPVAGSAEDSRDASNKRVSNSLMKSELGVLLAYPDIATGLARALGVEAAELSDGSISG
jgi:nucleoside-diphosphate-sugar epimerase